MTLSISLSTNYHVILIIAYISNHSVVNEVLNCTLQPGFQSRYLKTLTSNTLIPAHITNNRKFFPWFKGALGAIDGTHIGVRASAETRAAHRNRKGELTQNVLAACTFSMLFCYILAGMEGSAADSQLYDIARENR
jgi:hypothetical protein